MMNLLVQSALEALIHSDCKYRDSGSGSDILAGSGKLNLEEGKRGGGAGTESKVLSSGSVS